MNSYDNDWLLMLDDDLFFIEKDEGEKCIENTIQIQQGDVLATVQLERSL
jgi:hypothetical protein